MSKFTSKLPYTVAESLKIQPKEPTALAKARVHERRADTQRTDDEKGRLHVEFLERYRALEFAVGPGEALARKEWLGKLGVEEMRSHELLGHLFSKLSRPRLDAVMQDARIAELNVVLNRRDVRSIVEKNQFLQAAGLDWMTYLNAKRDLKFGLGLQAYKSAQAIACYLTVIRAACDPKVKKEKNLVSDEEVLTIACGLARDITTHVLEEMQNSRDAFFTSSERKDMGEKMRAESATKLGRKVAPSFHAEREQRLNPTSGPGKPAASKLPPGARRG